MKKRYFVIIAICIVVAAIFGVDPVPLGEIQSIKYSEHGGMSFEAVYYEEYSAFFDNE